VLHRFGEKTKTDKTPKNTLFQLLLITANNLIVLGEAERPAEKTIHNQI